jgi:UDP-3-O-[3-hydroxymyristoyl] N-acetylglucosamine deacetylase
VRLAKHPGPSAFLVGGLEVPFAAALAVQADRSTALDVGAATVATVEHLMAACASLGLYEGLSVEVTGGELPLLDGASTGFLHALRALGIPPSPPRLSVVREGAVMCGRSCYEFTRDARTTVEVELEWADRRLVPRASWDGTEDAFERIASARTFAFAHELARLVKAGHASHVSPESVVVIGPDAVLAAGRPFSWDEPARHKLLDLIGDMFVYGGPPRGHVRAFRPGHAATHALMRQALAEGVIA